MWTTAAGVPGAAAQSPGAGGGNQPGSSTGATAAPTTDIGNPDDQAATTDTGTRSSNNDLQQFIEKASIANMAEIQLSQLALQQAENPQVMQFARMMVDEHTRALEQLRTVASTQGLQVASELDNKHQKLHEKLSKLQGAEFDRAYMDAMVDSHKSTEKLLKKRAGKDASASAANMSGSQGTAGAIGTSGSDDESATTGTSGATSGSTETGTPSAGTPGTTGTSGTTGTTGSGVGATASTGAAGSAMAPTSADDWASMTLPKVRAHLEQARSLEDQVKESGRSNNNNNNNNDSGSGNDSGNPAAGSGSGAGSGGSTSGGSTPPQQ
jgi:putative membrane protein